MMNNNMKLGDLLVYAGKITDEQLKESLNEQKKSYKRLGEVLVNKGFVTEKDIIEVLEFQLGIPHVDLEKYSIDPNIAKMIPENLARRYELIALDKKRDYLIVAMVDPLNIFAIDDIKISTGYEIQPVISDKKYIINAIEKYYKEETTKKLLEEFEDSYYTSEIEEIAEEELLDVNSAPVVKLVNSIISQAVKMKSSDIHIEPFANEIKVRFRIDGDLQEIMILPKKSLSAIITRVKIMGKMDIAEKRVPQDGRIESIIQGKEIDMRISTLPTVYGEKIVIRLLDRSSFMYSKEELGFVPSDLKIVNKIMKQPYGIILVTGPTGSGKTTTLYTVLRELNSPEKNIITVEDPVEYKLQGINQVQVNNKAGLTFASGLRSILRQDPDIIMVGEIRDSETAQIAVRAAITGHLVLSTLHTNDTASSIARLVDMGIEPYLISSAVIGILSQRLVKRLCNNCKIPYEANSTEKAILGINTNENLVLYKGKGCNNCNNGYKGRTAIHEVMPIDEEIRELIDRRATTDEIKNTAIKKGMTTLLDKVNQLALDGTTTIDEVLRVGYTLG